MHDEDVIQMPTPPNLASVQRLHIAIVVASVLFVASLGLVGWTVTHQPPAPWAPLQAYADQEVLSRVPGVDGPAVKLGALLVVRGDKCTSETVKVRGAQSWQSVDIPGTVINTGQGVAIRQAGCMHIHYENPVPVAVAVVVRNGGPTRWIISGTETPLRPDGITSGLPSVWRTQEFEVVP